MRILIDVMLRGHLLDVLGIELMPVVLVEVEQPKQERFVRMATRVQKFEPAIDHWPSGGLLGAVAPDLQGRRVVRDIDRVVEVKIRAQLADELMRRLRYHQRAV